MSDLPDRLSETFNFKTYFLTHKAHNGRNQIFSTETHFPNSSTVKVQPNERNQNEPTDVMFSLT